MSANKVALVTGGTSGIGLSIAKSLSSSGYQLVLGGRDEPRGLAAEKEIQNSEFSRVDVTSEESIRLLIEKIKEKYGRLDCVINNAGIDFSHQDITLLTEEQYSLLMDTDFKSMVFMTKHAIPLLIESKGSMVNIGSQIGLKPDIEVPIYGAAKAAVIMFTKSMALSYGERGVRINCVCPGAIRTPLLEKFFDSEKELDDWYEKTVPLKRVGRSEEVASVVKFLVSDEASYVNGAVLSVDGGSSL